MSLFTLRPESGTVAQYYTIGNNQTVLLVGLGNVGKEYEGTRHNVGFDVLDAFVEKVGLSGWQDKKDMKCHLASGTVGTKRVIAIKPTTFMNLSGEAVQAVAHFYKIAPSDVLVIHDELDIPFGQIRLRVGGGPAGHNGIKSVSQHIGPDYGRVRIGIGPKLHDKQDSSDFVLAKFSKEQVELLPALRKEVVSILTEYVYGSQALPTETRSFI
ncbi:MAG: Peptidyl-tRNA hydrolase [Candidatus Saccharibacteria bacterium]|nr:Peptidyl-tRNA hydrolase [Candidatus Saccharibacteria bacterium]